MLQPVPAEHRLVNLGAHEVTQIHALDVARCAHARLLQRILFLASFFLKGSEGATPRVRIRAKLVGLFKAYP